MGHWDDQQLPFYWGLANTFPLADRWFGSCLGPTFPNRRFLVAAPPTVSPPTPPRSASTHPVRHDLRSAHPPRDQLDQLPQHHSHQADRLSAPRPRRPLVIARLAPTARGAPGAALHELESKLQFTADVFGVSMLRTPPPRARHQAVLPRCLDRPLAGLQHRRSQLRRLLGRTAPRHPARRTLRRDRDRRRHARTGLAIDTPHLVLRRTRRLLRPRSAAGRRRTRRRPPQHRRPDARYDRYGFRVPAVIVSPYARPARGPPRQRSTTPASCDCWRTSGTSRHSPAATPPQRARSAPSIGLATGVPHPPLLSPPALGLAPPPYRFAELPRR